MAELLAGALRRGQPLAALWAAEGAIYGRFGFGVATYLLELDMDTRAPLALRVEPDPSPLHLVEREAAPALLAGVHGRERARRAGLVARTPEWWTEAILHTPPEIAAQGLADARVVVIGDREDPAGYAVYRVRAPDDFDDAKPGRVEVQELIADTAAAAAGLWRYLASIDLTASLGAWNLPVDDPLPLLVADPDRARITRRLPALWLRLLDVPGALSARTWTVPPDVTIGVRDAFLPANAGAWRLEPGSCARTDAEPDLELDVGDLAATYLGGVPLSALHAAGVVEERTAGAVAALDAALRTPLAPHAPDDF
jgi:predicted acetyltransferase